MKYRHIILMMALLVLSAMALGCTGTGKNANYDFEVKGQVDKPGTYNLEDYKDKFVTVNAKLDGQVTHLPAQDYTGVPVRTVLGDAGVKSGASTLRVLADDGYTQVFDLSNVTASDNMILIDQNESVRLVANGYEGGYWVRNVKVIEVN